MICFLCIDVFLVCPHIGHMSSYGGGFSWLPASNQPAFPLIICGNGGYWIVRTVSSVSLTRSGSSTKRLCEPQGQAQCLSKLLENKQYLQKIIADITMIQSFANKYTYFKIENYVSWIIGLYTDITRFQLTVNYQFKYVTVSK